MYYQEIIHSICNQLIFMIRALKQLKIPINTPQNTILRKIDYFVSFIKSLAIWGLFFRVNLKKMGRGKGCVKYIILSRDIWGNAFSHVVQIIITLESIHFSDESFWICDDNYDKIKNNRIQETELKQRAQRNCLKKNPWIFTAIRLQENSVSAYQEMKYLDMYKFQKDFLYSLIENCQVLRYRKKVTFLLS